MSAMGLGSEMRTLNGPLTGDRTVLLTDVVNSVRLFEADPELARACLAIHDQIIDGAAREYSCEILWDRSEGDSRFLVFEFADEAIRCALEIQERLASNPWAPGFEIKVRIAAFTGQLLGGGLGHLGPVPNRCARLRQLCRPGEVLVPALTKEAAGEPVGIEFRDLGLHLLRDVGNHQIYRPQFAGRGAAPDESVSPDLPTFRTPFIGREAAVSKLRDLLPESRLVTIVAPGGMGKTRLAVRVAECLAPRSLDLTAFVRVETSGQVIDLSRAVASALGIAVSSESDPAALLEYSLRSRRAVLLLDNCEHALDAVTELVDRLIDRCEGVTVLATSRVPLRSKWETRFPLAPMQFGGGSEAERLFVHTVREQDPAFDLTEELRPDVEELCQVLGGMPLAIELGASLARVMSPQEVLERVREGTPLALEEGPFEPRHRSLDEVLAWSFELLGPAQRDALLRLCLFRGGWTLDSVEAVTGVDDPVGLMSRLTESCLVTRSVSKDGSRFSMSDVIRSYGLRLLERSDTWAVAIQDYVRHWVAFAEEADRQVYGGNSTKWYASTERELDNLLQAADLARKLPHRDEEIRLWSALCHCLVNFGLIRQVQERLEAALEEASRPASESACITGWIAVARLWLQLARYEEVEQITLPLSENPTASPVQLAMILVNRGLALPNLGRYDEAVECYRRALTIARTHGLDWMEGGILTNTSLVLLASGKYEEAWASLTAALDVPNWNRSPANLIWFNIYGSDAKLNLGHVDEALRLAQAAVELSSRHGRIMTQSLALNRLGHALRALGRTRESLQIQAEALRLQRSANLDQYAGRTVEYIAKALVMGGVADERVAVLSSAAEARVRRTYLPWDEIHRCRRESLEALMGPDLVGPAWLRGIELSLEETYDLALTLAA